MRLINIIQLLKQFVAGMLSLTSSSSWLMWTSIFCIIMMVLRKLDKMKSYCVYCLNIFMRLDINSHLITLIVTMFTLLSMLLRTLTMTNIYIVLLPSDNDNITLSTYIMIQQSKADWPQVKVLLAQIMISFLKISWFQSCA